MKLIQDILKDDENSTTVTITTTNNKLDVLPSPIIQEISSFLAMHDFVKFEKMNRTIFVAINLPSKLKKIDLRCTNQFPKRITLNQFEQILSNNHHIKWLAIPAYLLQQIHGIKWNGTLEIEHFECTFDDGDDDDETGLINNLDFKSNIRENIINNLVKNCLFPLNKILSLTIDGG